MWSFSPPDDEIYDEIRSVSPVSLPDPSMQLYRERGESSRARAAEPSSAHSADVVMEDADAGAGDEPDSARPKRRSAI